MPADRSTTPNPATALTASTSAPAAIRRAAPADATDVATMVGEIATHEDQAAHVHVDVEQWRGLPGRPDVTVLLAERSGRPVGYVSAVRHLHLWTGGGVLALDDLYVRPGHRDGGVDRQLMAALAALAASEQLLILRPRTPRARRLPHRRGLSAVGVPARRRRPHHRAIMVCAR
jgi:ribosomal protein S18 acetylase RimI-like enzyme